MEFEEIPIFVDIELRSLQTCELYTEVTFQGGHRGLEPVFDQRDGRFGDVCDTRPAPRLVQDVSWLTQWPDESRCLVHRCHLASDQPTRLSVQESSAHEQTELAE